MNAAQFDRAAAVIERADFLCTSFLVSDSPIYLHNPERPIPRGFVCCALGELALDAGHSRDDLILAQTPPACDEYTVRLPLLASVYGLDEAMCDGITSANDEPIEALGEADALEFALDFDGVESFRYDLARARKAAVLHRLASFVAVEIDEEIGEGVAA